MKAQGWAFDEMTRYGLGPAALDKDRERKQGGEARSERGFPERSPRGLGLNLALGIERRRLTFHPTLTFILFKSRVPSR